jgi:Flp pilus assembly protein TadG
LVETALVVTFLAFLVMGIVEVGFAFARTNMIVHGLREGARYGATLGQRNTGTGCLTSAGTTSIQTYVNGIMTSIGFTPAGGANGIMVTQGCNNSAPTIAIGVTGSLNTAFNLIGTSFSVNRSVTFEDEGRTVPPGGACNPC